MKVLDAGSITLSNADVVDWVKRKRGQHAREDADDKTKGFAVQKRPANFMRILARTERELQSDYYPYTKNSSVYAGDKRADTFAAFALAAETAVQDHLDAEWKDRIRTMTTKQRDTVYASQQEKKCLSDPELLMIYNYAPSCVEMLEPMIERVEDRFTKDELQLLVDVVVRHLRPDEENLLSSTK